VPRWHCNHLSRVRTTLYPHGLEELPAKKWDMANRRVCATVCASMCERLHGFEELTAKEHGMASRRVGLSVSLSVRVRMCE